jgi:carbonic anhydrase/acetyltransferase-like protein (isoleucine patch superfamily)
MPLFALDGERPECPESGRFWVAPGAYVIGNVMLGDEASVWFNAVIRGDREPIRIGVRSNVQDCAVLHTDMGYPLTVGANCTIGHGAIVHGCTISDGCLIGMGATILNGAVIGAASLVGAGALVTEGKVFPDRSLIVGSPAKAVRALDDSAVARLMESADAYVANWRRLSAGIVEVK